MYISFPIYNVSCRISSQSSHEMHKCIFPFQYIMFHFVKSGLAAKNIQSKVSVFLPFSATLAWNFNLRHAYKTYFKRLFSFFFRTRWGPNLRQVLPLPQMLRSHPDECQAGRLRHAAARQEGFLRARLQRGQGGAAEGFKVSSRYMQCTKRTFLHFSCHTYRFATYLSVRFKEF